MFIQDINKNININTVEKLNKEILTTFVRDYKQDIIYNPFNTYTKKIRISHYFTLKIILIIYVLRTIDK